MILFEDRREGGMLLAERLQALAGKDCVVLGLPRGGVPVAYEVARASFTLVLRGALRLSALLKASDTYDRDFFGPDVEVRIEADGEIPGESQAGRHRHERLPRRQGSPGPRYLSKDLHRM